MTDDSAESTRRVYHCETCRSDFNDPDDLDEDGYGPICPSCGGAFVAVIEMPEPKEQSPRDFDAIEINIRINDEIVTGEECRMTSMITEEELEASKHDTVEMPLRTMTDAIIRRYNEYRDEND